MLHPQYPCLPIHVAYDEKAYAGDVKEEEDERLECHVSNAVIYPRAIMIHHINAPVAFAAVMHAQHFQGATVVAFCRIFLRLVFIFLLWCMLIDIILILRLPKMSLL